ncbi:MAG: hypothetical protein EOP06_30945 [Proteobacteria bacterium]|nr:MAG: hypothetical protein EOP06_30945 [Pseudomonadota bacterium]
MLPGFCKFFQYKKIESATQLRAEAARFEALRVAAMPRFKIIKERGLILAPELPGVLKDFALSLVKPELSEIEFEKGQRGFLVHDAGASSARCPSWPSSQVGRVQLQSLRKTEHVTRYEFISKFETVFVETRLGPFRCETDIVLQSL